MDTFVAQPALKHRDREMIPRVLVRAMAGLVAATLALVSFAVLTGRPPVGSPAPAAVVEQRVISLVGRGAQAVTVLDENGAVLADMAHGGFVTVVQNALETARRRHGVDPDLPVRLVRYANGRLAVEDPIIGWSVELYAFGADNKAAFERLLTK